MVAPWCFSAIETPAFSGHNAGDIDSIRGVRMFEPVLNSLPAFAMFFAAAIALLAAFIGLYALITPYNELALIRAGNVAAATSLSGALLGIALPVAVAVAVSHSLVVMVAWGVVACAIQLLAFLATRLLLPHLVADIPAGRLASAVFLAALSLGVGIINAACII